MESVAKFIKSIRSGKINNEMMQCYAAYGIFGAAVLYIFYCGQIATIGLAVGVAMILYAVLGGNITVSLIAGALVGLIAVHYSRPVGSAEGFEDAEEAEESEGFEEKSEETPEEKPEEKTEEKFTVQTAQKKKKRAAPPNNGSRAEMFELGKKYKMPSEEDDSEFHLDAGTTFLNAYKSLKPDQIAAMTKDTQDLMQTQKQLMGTLQTLKPLIKDGKEMMEMFQSYFGSGNSSTA